MHLPHATLTFASLSLAASVAAAQKPDTAAVQKTFFTRRDAIATGAALAVSAGVSVFDKRIARWTQTSNVQGSQSRRDLFDNLTVINEQPLTLGAVAVYGIGRLTGSKVTAEVGLHATEAFVMTVAGSELIRGPLGRFRPRVSPDDQYKTSFWRGFTDFGARSFPSIHSAMGFATASVVVGELREHQPGAVPYAAPILYAAALVPGATRMYLNQHWASDVVAGAFLGHLIGSRVVSYAYSHRRTKLDRVLLGGVSMVPDGRGGVLLMKSLGER